MKRNKMDYVQYVGGILILTLGVALSSKAGLGTGSLDSINFALASRTQLNLSIVIVLMAFVAIFISAVIRRGKLSFKTLMTAIFMGVFTESWVKIIEIITVDTIAQQIIVFALAIFCVSLGIAIYLRPKFPANPNDDMIVALNEVLGLKMGTAKLFIDIIAIVIALLLKGPVGIGTVLMTVLIGPIVNLINSIINKFTPSSIEAIEKSVV
ncbi:YitT family protein [Turicibacter sp. TJ11]|uniref:YczE/YyaS/YitT family protein n=1 Tax=Turicibacter sp. TJ11 TaxID=2806443 RepID=UPI001F41A2A4|nr:hypothetical protein [Turicibacter sp. TJ11]